MDLHPEFVRWDGREPNAENGAADAVRFDCPEGHPHCWHTVPFTPALDGAARTSPQSNGAHWQRRGDTLETLVLSPSIRSVCGRCVRQADPACTGCHFHGYVGGSSGQMPGFVELWGDSK
jgi:hypothetical protein